ncbi:PKD domain-containing protein [Nocardioides sp. R1-1]|uniref:PKD domain-containing protein n=1 Tax=Nocardioides sp. R1-1 TaxID=3383502 RepID=UPI0038D10F1F
MMARAAVLLIGAIWPWTLNADDPDAGTSGTGFWLQQLGKVQGSAPTKHGEPQRDTTPVLIGQGACDAADQVAGMLVTASFCDESEPVVTIDDVRRAFGELKLPPGTLVIQPPDGLTLVNFETNFYTTATTPIATTITLLEQAVTLEATPTSYTWDFGDGHTVTTDEPGAPYPDLTITHDYQHTGDYQPSLATTYTGRYRIADGPWQTIPDTVTIPGPTQALRVIEAQPKLVGY